MDHGTLQSTFFVGFIIESMQAGVQVLLDIASLRQRFSCLEGSKKDQHCIYVD
jgi:hypothetical protein